MDFFINGMVFLFLIDLCVILPLLLYLRKLSRNKVIELAGVLHDWLQDFRDITKDIDRILE